MPQARTASPMAAAAAATARSASPPQQLARQRQPRQSAYLLWPLKKKDGLSVSWSDLLVLAATLPWNRWGSKRLALASAGPTFRLEEDVLGPRGHVARRRALQRRQGARRSGRGRADGPHLREPGGAQRQPGSAGCRQGHSRDLRPHGDERRGDRCAHRRRPHVRQDPWRCARRLGTSARTGGRALEEQGLGWINKGTAPAWAPTRSPAVSRVRGPTTRSSGTTVRR